MPKEFPERELIRRTYTVREMDLPPSVLLAKKSMVRWIALALGLISEKESRDTIVEILDLLFYYNFSKKDGAESDELHRALKARGIKVSDKLVRYHLKNMADLGLLEKRGKKYFFSSASDSERQDIKSGFKEKIGKNINASVERIANVMEKIAEGYGKK